MGVREHVFVECSGSDDGYCFFDMCILGELFDSYESVYYVEIWVLV